jgi:ribosomal protein S18 acetylase RimI-like enzyme
MALVTREMRPDDYDAALALWRSSPGVQLAGGDTRDGIRGFLERNPGHSFVACEGDRLVAVALCGHDGRRGYLHHLAVADEHRERGVGRSLVERCLAELRRAGIAKCHVFVARENKEALAFWGAVGWILRDDLEMLSFVLGDDSPPE